jgi:hypothetical protein
MSAAQSVTIFIAPRFSVALIFRPGCTLANHLGYFKLYSPGGLHASGKWRIPKISILSTNMNVMIISIIKIFI